MAKEVFTVAVELPEGVTAAEFASHLADAHRAAVRDYHRSDPLSRSAEIVVEFEEARSLTLVA